MRRLLVLIGLLICVECVVRAELRMWTAADGSSTIEASFFRVVDDKVELVRKDGRRIKVPIAKLSDGDREYIAEQTGGEMPGKSSADAGAPSLPYEVGRVMGPIEADTESHYYYYVPKSLKPGRKAPLLFYSNSGGGTPGHLQQIIEGAELCQWVLAMSLESRNGRDFEVNLDCNEEAVEHIYKTLPVDEDRVYFTGNSGGAAAAFGNFDNLDGYGMMPSIGYIPNEISPPRCDTFIINGAWDFNRYISALAHKQIGDSAIQRFFPGGHWDAPAWIMNEGIVWLEGRYLAERGKKYPDIQQAYEQAVLEWIVSLKEREPHRAYYWALFLQDELKLTAGSSVRVASLVRELGADRNNRLYVEGIVEINEFAEDELSQFGHQSRMHHSDPGVVSECESMLNRYTGVPVIEDILKGLMKQTDSL